VKATENGREKAGKKKQTNRSENVRSFDDSKDELEVI
jgi:hypothetical protein